eukprot:GHVO01033222.1.p1 GENE.GHVO01033222.1~~GHVO01033222.1.p1  ORF type:complete len:241 (+),score=57.41 GHVO01033222.1:196-918(+)
MRKLMTPLVPRAPPPPNPFTLLYPPTGPTPREETSDYAPPEASYTAPPRSDKRWRKPSYDMWSLGVTILEMATGRTDSFNIISRKANSKLRAYIQKNNLDPIYENEIRYFMVLNEMCLCDPVPEVENTKASTDLISGYFRGDYEDVERLPKAHADEQTWRWKCKTIAAEVDPDGASKVCDDEEFSKQIRLRDVAGVGLASSEARDILRQLLNVEPGERPTAESLLEHEWFLRDVAIIRRE